MVGYESITEYGEVTARGTAKARTYTRATPAETGKVIASGIQNLSEQAMIALSLVLQARKRRRA